MGREGHWVGRGLLSSNAEGPAAPHSSTLYHIAPQCLCPGIPCTPRHPPQHHPVPHKNSTASPQCVQVRESTPPRCTASLSTHFTSTSRARPRSTLHSIARHYDAAQHNTAQHFFSARHHPVPPCPALTPPRPASALTQPDSALTRPDLPHFIRTARAPLPCTALPRLYCASTSPLYCSAPLVLRGHISIFSCGRLLVGAAVC